MPPENPRHETLRVRVAVRTLRRNRHALHAAALQESIFSRFGWSNQRWLAQTHRGLLAHYWANCGDLDVPLISKATLPILAEPLVLSSISVPNSSRVNHMFVDTP